MYDWKKIIFEIEFVCNQKRKWKEYYINDKLKFKGEYLFDKKWNGKEYDEKGNIIYEIINGNGKIKEYNDRGKLIYEGEYLN